MSYLAPCNLCGGTNGGHYESCPNYGGEKPNLAMRTARDMATQLRSEPNVTPAMLMQAAAIIDTLCDVLELRK